MAHAQAAFSTGPRRWAVWATIGLLGAAVGGGVAVQAARGSGEAAAASTTAPVTVPPTTATPATTTTQPPITTPVLTRTISKGMTGDDVRMVQQRLIDLHFDPGPVDGVYGLQTMQSIWAFQSLILGRPHDQVTDDVTPELWTELEGDWLLGPRRVELSSTHLEAYLPEQALVVFKDDIPILITHISSGSGEHWCEQVTIEPGEYGNENGTEPLVTGMCGDAITTGGTFKITRKMEPKDDPDGDGWRKGALGEMYRPVYWNYGLAIHGSAKVPNENLSHGCIRLPMHVAKYFPELVEKGDDIFVFDGVKVPEAYGHQPPPIDQPDPDYVPTASGG